MSSADDWRFLRKFGQNPDAANGEDVWTLGTAYTWPSAAAATTIVSSNANDTAAGTGARQVQVLGLDSGWLLQEETVALDGATPVTLANQYLRVFRAFVVSVGSDASQTNLGDIDVKHDATVLARIGAGLGQTLMAIYTVPADWHEISLMSWFVNVGRSANAATASLNLWQRPNPGAWRVVASAEINTQGNSEANFQYRAWEPLAPRTDLRISVVNVSAASMVISGGFELAAAVGDVNRLLAARRVI